MLDCLYYIKFLPLEPAWRSRSANEGLGTAFEGISQVLGVVMEQVHLHGLCQRKEARFRRLGAEAKRASNLLDFEIENHDEGLVAIGIDYKLVGVTVDASQAKGADFQAGLLLHFPLAGLRHRFTRIDGPTGKA